MIKKLITIIKNLLTPKREYLTIKEDGTTGVTFKK